MNGESWFSRYQFCAPVGQCGAGIFYLAKDRDQQMHVVVKQYLSSKQEEQVQQMERLFQDEARLFGLLKEKGLVQFFDCHVLEGKFFLVIDVPSACELMCTHLKPETIERAIQKRGFGTASSARPGPREGGADTGIRAQVLEVIVRQAISGIPWREICAGPMQMNGISVEEIEEEVRKRSGESRKS